jgi:hypothetical protein
MTTHDAKTAAHVHAVVFHSYPKLLFAWPLILAGYVLYLLPAAWTTNHAEYGWLYMAIAFLVVLTMGVDLERNIAVFWVVLIGGFYALGLWLRDAQHITFFGDIYNYFLALNVRYSPSLGLGLSIFLSVPYAVMLIWSRIQDKWRITHNEFEHLSWGRADDSLARGAKRVRTTYPDVFELLLAGAGTLIVYSANGTTELRRIQHVPMLPLIRGKITRLLESTSVVDEPARGITEEEDGGLDHDASHEADAAGSGGDKL